MSICVKAGQVTVTVPERFSFEAAENFVNSKREWILKSIQRLKSKEKQQTVYNVENEFRTKFRTMKLLTHDRNNLRLQIFDSHFEICYPEDAELESEAVQSVIRKMMEHVWKVEAHEYLPERIKQIADFYNMKYKTLSIKNTRSFWGQCRGDNSIVLSLHLMHLPDHLIDYVIIHELCHTVHKNHQAEFWKLLNSMTGGKAKMMASEMRSYSTRIY